MVRTEKKHERSKMPELIASNLTKEGAEALIAAAVTRDVEMGDAIVSADSKTMYVNVGSATPADLAALGVPTCCSGSGEFFSYCGTFCLITVIVPCAVLLPLSAGEPALAVVAIVLVALGVFYFLWSLRVTLTAGGVCLPPPPPRASAFVAAKEGPPELQHRKAPPKKLYVIVNPHGGLQKGPRALKEVVLPIWEKEFGIEATVLETKYGGGASWAPA